MHSATANAPAARQSALRKAAPPPSTRQLRSNSAPWPTLAHADRAEAIHGRRYFLTTRPGELTRMATGMVVRIERIETTLVERSPERFHHIANGCDSVHEGATCLVESVTHRTHLAGIGNLLEAMLDIPYGAAIFLVFVIVAVYTSVGGFHSVVKTDVIQGVLMVFLRSNNYSH